MFLEVLIRAVPPFDWARNNEYDTLDHVLMRVFRHPEPFGLDVLDAVLHASAEERDARMLDQILTSAGSAWEVTDHPDEGWQLTRRAVGPVIETLDAIRSPSERAHHHLVTAWGALMGRDPDPSTAYRESIRAVEVVAKPVVIPDDSLATLGKIIRAISDAPSKWTTVLDHSTPEQVGGMAEMIWKGQIDRHGTDDPDAPLSVSQEEADSAFHIALALVRLFVSGGIRPRH